MTELSSQQASIVHLPLGPIAVTACAGSGKTFTAVRRLVEMRRKLLDRHGNIALLSFSNVAVDTFRRDYVSLLRADGAGRSLWGVEIDTVDGFITSNILKPHARLEMACDGTPFLLEGHEPFLNNSAFKLFDGRYGRFASELAIGIENGTFIYKVGRGTQSVKIGSGPAEKVLSAIAKHGAYTHEAGRYWALRTLRNRPFILRAMVRRYPHILVDEAQDIGQVHQAILDLLVSAGSRLSLIGDENQGIYEFSGANGAFLRSYGTREGVVSVELQTNYRSVPEIVDIANRLSKRTDKAARTAPKSLCGAYYFSYSADEVDKACLAFGSLLDAAEIDHNQAAILCRSSALASTWRGDKAGPGQKAVKAFAVAAITRDKKQQFGLAYKSACEGVVSVLAPQFGKLSSQLSRVDGDQKHRVAQRLIWNFTRNDKEGLPSAKLIADTEWHPLLVSRVKTLIEKLVSDCGFEAAENLGQRLSKKGLESKPLLGREEAGEAVVPKFRISTVHKVKGESIAGVMYVVTRDHVEKMLDGTKHEVGRIGYVALTRACNLFVLAVSESVLGSVETRLNDMGFKKV